MIVDSQKRNNDLSIEIPFLGSLDHLLNLDSLTDDAKKRLSKLIRSTKKSESYFIKSFVAAILCVLFCSVVMLVVGLVTQGVQSP